MDAGTLIGAGITAVLGSAATTALVNGIFQRGKTKVDAVAELAGAASDFVDRLEKSNESALAEAAASRKEAATSRHEAETAARAAREAEWQLEQIRRQTGQLNRDLAAARQEVVSLVQTLRQWRAAILRPDATLEELRLLVRQPPGVNGSGLPT